MYNTECPSTIKTKWLVSWLTGIRKQSLKQLSLTPATAHDSVLFINVLFNEILPPPSTSEIKNIWSFVCTPSASSNVA
jgi:hypothetical protein